MIIQENIFNCKRILLRNSGVLWYNITMKQIDAAIVQQELTRLITDCLIAPDKAVTAALTDIRTDSILEKTAAALIVENNRIAQEKRLFCCQDTGQAVFFVRMGDRAVCPGLEDAIHGAVKSAYAAARKSVADPITRKNTGDNTPAIIEYFLTRGETLEITFLAKGAGSENMSRLYMLTPADG